MTRYTTRQVAKAVSVHYQTLLRWLYAEKVPEPQRIRLGGQNLRLWTKQEIAAVRKFKAKNYDVARSRKKRKKK
jgi:hypothetical protein